MRQGFLSRFFATFTALFLLNIPLQAEPVRFADFEWQNRFLIACDLKRPSDASDWTAQLGQIILADRANSRRLRVGLLGSDNWSVFELNQSSPDRLVSLFGRDCETDDCRDQFYYPDNQRLITRMGCTAERVSFALIGLDGGVKKIWRDSVPKTEEVFALIDAMPMRVQELAAQSSGN